MKRSKRCLIGVVTFIAILLLWYACAAASIGWNVASWPKEFLYGVLVTGLPWSGACAIGMYRITFALDPEP